MNETDFWNWAQSTWLALVDNAQLLSNLGTFLSAFVATVVLFITRRQLKTAKLQAAAALEQVEVAREQMSTARMQSDAAMSGLEYQRNSVRSAELSRFDGLAPQVFVRPLGQVDIIATDKHTHTGKESFAQVDQSVEWVHTGRDAGLDEYYSIWIRGSVFIGNDGDKSALLAFSDEVSGIPEGTVRSSFDEYLLHPGQTWEVTWYKLYLVEMLIERHNNSQYIKFEDSLRIGSSCAINPDVVDNWRIEFNFAPLYQPHKRAHNKSEGEFGEGSYKTNLLPAIPSVFKRRSYPMLDSPVADRDLKDDFERSRYFGPDKMSSDNRKMLGYE
ncbi:hypothetical protein AB0L13_11465 [Saccharopolyspora shandongensis]|uniref:hypothetical protein n=1 Tax=Saccharopolyspora shandongensis TaxID=418495 RepID=UPI00341F6B17